MNNAPASTLTGQVVSLLDILRAHAEVYVRATKTLTLITTLINEEKNKGADVRLNVGLLQRLKAVLDDLLRHCEYLPMTALAASDLVEVIDSPTIMPAWTQTELSLMTSLASGRDLPIMEAKEGQADCSEKLEGRVGLHLGLCNMIAGLKPRTLQRG